MLQGEAEPGTVLGASHSGLAFLILLLSPKRKVTDGGGRYLLTGGMVVSTISRVVSILSLLGNKFHICPSPPDSGPNYSCCRPPKLPRDALEGCTGSSYQDKIMAHADWLAIGFTINGGK